MIAGRGLGYVCVAFVLALAVSAAQAQESDVKQLAAQGQEARAKGEWDKLNTLCDQILSIQNLSDADRGAAVRNKLTALKGMDPSLEKAMAFYEDAIKNQKLDPMWQLILMVDAAQITCGNPATLDKGLAIADDALGLVGDMSGGDASKRDPFLWSRWLLVTGAKADALRGLKKDKEFAELSYNALKEMDGAEYAADITLAGFLKGLMILSATGDKKRCLEGAAFAVKIATRSKNVKSVRYLLERLQLEGFDKVASGEDKAQYPTEIAALRTALLAVKDVPFEDKEAGKAVVDMATAYAEKF